MIVGIMSPTFCEHCQYLKGVQKTGVRYVLECRHPEAESSAPRCPLKDYEVEVKTHDGL